jgi:hypothetical protein
MTKAQWSAVYDYCTEYGYDTPKELLTDLKENGTVPQGTKLSELAEYVSGKTYDDMFQFLGENL